MTRMKEINQTIVVEGRYDKIKLSSFIKGTIIETNGFSIYNDKPKQELIKTLAKKNGVIILTDSDFAGFQIRNFVISLIENQNYINVYIPDVYGKEKRKTRSSKEGKVGVEGISKEDILSAFELAGAFDESGFIRKNEIKKSQLFHDGLYGKKNSADLRREFQESLNLPKRLSANGLLAVLNNLFTIKEYKSHLRKFYDYEREE